MACGRLFVTSACDNFYAAGGIHRLYFVAQQLMVEEASGHCYVVLYATNKSQRTEKKPGAKRNRIPTKIIEPLKLFKHHKLKQSFHLDIFLICSFVRSKCCCVNHPSRSFLALHHPFAPLDGALSHSNMLPTRVAQIYAIGGFKSFTFQKCSWLTIM